MTKKNVFLSAFLLFCLFLGAFKQNASGIKNMRKSFIIILSLFSFISFAQTKIRPPFLQYESDQWVDSVFNTLSIDERIGQLLMVPAYSSKGNSQLVQLIKMVEENKIGGIITMQGGPMRHINMVNQLQKVSKTPLLV